MKMVVKEGGGEVVRRANGVDVAGEVQVELFHWDHLAVATTSGAALDTEDRAEARLSDRYRCLLPNHVEPLRKSDRCGGLPFAEWGWRDRRHHHVLAALAELLHPLNRLNRDLRLGSAVGLHLVWSETKVCGNRVDRLRRDAARDL